MSRIGGLGEDRRNGAIAVARRRHVHVRECAHEAVLRRIGSIILGLKHVGVNLPRIILQLSLAHPIAVVVIALLLLLLPIVAAIVEGGGTKVLDELVQGVRTTGQQTTVGSVGVGGCIARIVLQVIRVLFVAILTLSALDTHSGAVPHHLLESLLAVALVANTTMQVATVRMARATRFDAARQHDTDLVGATLFVQAPPTFAVVTKQHFVFGEIKVGGTLDVQQFHRAVFRAPVELLSTPGSSHVFVASRGRRIGRLRGREGR